MASVDLLAGVAWRVNRTTPAASSATATAVAHGKRPDTTAQHLHGMLPGRSLSSAQSRGHASTAFRHMLDIFVGNASILIDARCKLV